MKTGSLLDKNFCGAAFLLVLILPAAISKHYSELIGMCSFGLSLTAPRGLPLTDGRPVQIFPFLCFRDFSFFLPYAAVFFSGLLRNNLKLNNDFNEMEFFHVTFVFQQAQASLSESSQRLDLIRHSLELRNKELPPQQSAKAMELKKELESYTVSSPTPSGGSSYVSLQPFKQGQGGGQVGDTPTSCSSSSHLLGKSAAITGKLEVRLMGCQDLLEDVPGRSRRDSTHSAPNDLKSFVKGMPFFV